MKLRICGLASIPVGVGSAETPIERDSGAVRSVVGIEDGVVSGC
jgi:hypothetical protein